MNDSHRLSRIDTLWSVVQQAHRGEDTAAFAAQHQLMDQYGGAVRRYLLGALRDEDAADEVFQEFALRFVRGDFQNATPERGRFRNFVKTSIYHLIVDYQRRAKKDRRIQKLIADCHEREIPPPWKTWTMSSQSVGETNSWRERGPH